MAALPPGFTLDQAVPQTAAAPQLPPGFSLDQSQPGFVDRLTQDVQGAWSGAGKQIADNTNENQKLGPMQIPDPRNALAVAGAFGQTTAAPVIEAVKSAWNYTPQAGKDFVEKAASGIWNSAPVQAVAKPVGGAINAGGQQYDQWAQTHPQTASAVSDLGQNASNMLNASIIPGRGVAAITNNVIDPAIEKLGGAVSGAATNLNNAMGDTIRATPDQVKAAASAGYKQVENSGLSFPQSMIDNVVTDAQSKLPQTAKAQAAFSQSESGKLLQGLDVYKGSPLTLQEANELDQQLGDFISNKGESDLGKLNADGKQVYQLQKNLRQSMVDAAQNGNISGNPDDVQSWQNAVKDWSAQSKMNDIQRIVDKGNMMDNPATSIKNGFKNYVNSPRINSMPPDVQDAMRQVANGAPIQNFFRTGPGSRLLGMVGGAAGGGLPGAMAGFAASGAARDVAGSLQGGQLEKVMDAIAGHSSMPTQIVNQPVNPTSEWFPQYGPAEAPPPAPMLALPAPAQDLITNSQGATRQATPQEQSAMIGQRQEAAKLGMTPDVYGNIARNDLRARIGPAWDAIDGQKQQQIADQVNQMWKQNAIPLSDIIDQAKQSAQDLAAAKDQPFQETGMSQAFRQAIADFDRKRALSGVAK